MSKLLVGPLVRAVLPDRVAIWTEWSMPCEVTLTAAPYITVPSTAQTLTQPEVSGKTITVGEHFYALLILAGLQAGTWYRYHISAASLSMPEEVSIETGEGTRIQCFRTLDSPEVSLPLRLAYGSCRNLSETAPDTLNAFGDWLVDFQEEQESRWPHLLLLIGDQIYADEPIEARFPRQPRPEQPAVQSFEDYAKRYTIAWTRDKGVRQVLAALPTAMIFDDHEITNGWNSSPHWQLEMLQQGFESTLVDGLVAYWIYQGWGNICLQDASQHALLAIMQPAQEDQDLLTALRARIRRSILYRETFAWHYALPTTPPIFVADARGNRAELLAGENPDELTPRIVSKKQMDDLQSWAQQHAESVALLVSSVPALLPPVIGLAEYSMGVRLFGRSSSRMLQGLRRRLSAGQQAFAERLSFDHWQVFGETWRELVNLFAERKRDLVILSGDVHFSYAIRASRAPFRDRSSPQLYQLVASPFRNALGTKESLLISGQAWLPRAFYSGLHLRMLPLHKKGARRAPPRILFQNVIALVTFNPLSEGRYSFQQTYLGIRSTKLEEIGSLSSD